LDTLKGREAKMLNRKEYWIIRMSMQISLKLSDKMFNKAKKYSSKKGYDSLQDFIRELMRERLFEKEQNLSGILTALASQKSLAKNWENENEDKAWEHLQKEM
jgi:metal-responsive CopG/Arc/MetJ family transcriptional regulator